MQNDLTFFSIRNIVLWLHPDRGKPAGVFQLENVSIYFNIYSMFPILNNINCGCWCKKENELENLHVWKFDAFQYLISAFIYIIVQTTQTRDNKKLHLFKVNLTNIKFTKALAVLKCNIMLIALPSTIISMNLKFNTNIKVFYKHC